MAKLTRRGFLKQSTVSVATIGALTAGLALPELAADPEASEVAATDLAAAAATFSGPLLAHVRDIATGEISLLVGAQEIIYRDTQLVMRLLQATK